MMLLFPLCDYVTHLRRKILLQNVGGLGVMQLRLAHVKAINDLRNEHGGTPVVRRSDGLGGRSKAVLEVTPFFGALQAMEERGKARTSFRNDRVSC